MKQMKMICFLGVLILLAGILSTIPAGICRAESPSRLLLEDDSLRVTLLSAESVPEGISLQLSCLNRTDRQETLHSLIPRMDGKDTVFISGWPGEDSLLPPGEETAVSLIICPAENQAETVLPVSLRFTFRGMLSTQAQILSLAPEVTVSPASFDSGEPQIVRSEILSSLPAENLSVQLRDRITPEQAALLDYGQAWICLESDEGLLPFCCVRLQVDESGEASAFYSGRAACFEGDSLFPLSVREAGKEGTAEFTTREISMTGESVFYATLTLSVLQNPDGTWQLANQVLSSSELGGDCHQAPLGLLDQAEAVLPAVNPSDPVQSVSVRSVCYPLDEPLTLRIVRAADLGEIWVYYEYFFMDNSDIVHSPLPLNHSDGSV